MICFIGDSHGRFDALEALMRTHPITVQVGDHGLGFHPATDMMTIKRLDAVPGEHWFFGGNHDDPSVCMRSTRCLGDFGVCEIDGRRVGFIRGAWSIDRDLRVLFVDWWPNEELGSTQLDAAVDLLVDARPDIIATHDGPHSILCEMFADTCLHQEIRPTRTSGMLDVLFKRYQPQHWVFGHWHKTMHRTFDGTQFRCLAELDTLAL